MKAPIRNGTKVILKSLDGGDLPAIAIIDEDRYGGILLGIAPPVKGTPFVVVYVIPPTGIAVIDPARWDEAVAAMWSPPAVGTPKG
jgi:hypothetical protein